MRLVATGAFLTLALAGPAVAEGDDLDADLRKRVGSWLRSLTPKKLTVLTKHPNKSKRVKSRGGYTKTRIDRPYSKRIPRARTFSESRVTKATWGYLAPSARAALGKAGKATLIAEVVREGRWKGRPLMLEDARIDAVVLHRDRATVVLRATPVEQVWCERTRGAKQTPHCPGVHDRRDRHDRRERHPAFGFEKKQQLFWHPPGEITTVWVRERGKFYLALKETSFGERLAADLPERAGTESFARWEDGGRAKDAKVADVGTISKTGERRLTIRSGGRQLVLVAADKATFPALTVGARVVFSGTFRLYQPPRKKDERGRPKGRAPAPYVRGVGTVRPLK